MSCLRFCRVPDQGPGRPALDETCYVCGLAWTYHARDHVARLVREFREAIGLPATLATRAARIWLAASERILREERRKDGCTVFRAGRSLTPATRHSGAKVVFQTRPMGPLVVPLEGALIKMLYRAKPDACVNVALDCRGHYVEGQRLYVVGLDPA